MCLWSISGPSRCKRFAAVCWRYPRAATSTQLPPVDHGPEISCHAGLNGIGFAFSLLFNPISPKIPKRGFFCTFFKTGVDAAEMPKLFKPV